MRYIKNSDLNEEFGGNFDLRPAFTDSLNLFEHDIPGLYVHHVKGLTIDDFKLTSDKQLPGFYTEGIFIRDSRDIQIDGFIGSHLKGKSALKLLNSKNISIRDSQARENTRGFVTTDKVEDLKMVNNDCSEAEKSISEVH